MTTYFKESDREKLKELLEEILDAASGETNVNLEMVRDGYVLVYKKYLGNCPNTSSDFLAAEDLAKQHKLKFWSQTNLCKLWNYRRGKCSDKVQNNPNRS